MSLSTLDPVGNSKASRKAAPHRFHPARLLYLFLAAFIANLVLGAAQVVVTSGPNALLDLNQLNQTYIGRIAITYPLLFWSVLFICMVATVIGWALDRRFTAEEKSRAQQETSARVDQQISAQISATQMPIARARELRRETFKLGDDVAANFPYIEEPVREAFDAATQALTAAAAHRGGKRGLLVLGQVNAGKTRLAFEALSKSLPEWAVIRWRPDDRLEWLPQKSLRGQQVVVFIDDLQDYVPMGGREVGGVQLGAVRSSTLRALWETVTSLTNDVALLATCRTEDEARVRGGLGWLFEEVAEVRLPRFNVSASDEVSAEIIGNFTDRGAEHTDDWDGTIGSLVLGLSRKREQYDQLKTHDELAAASLRAMKLLTAIAIPNLTEQRIRAVCEDIFGRALLEKDEWRWRYAIDQLISLQFVSEAQAVQDERDKSLTIRKDSYYDQVITDYPAPGRENQLATDEHALIGVFTRLRDTAGLATLGFSLIAGDDAPDDLPKELVEQVSSIFDQILAFDPTDALSLTFKAILIAELGRNDEALADLDRALTLEPTAATWPALGVSDAELGHTTRAWTWNCRGSILAELNRFDEALAACDQATQMEPDNAAYWDDKGDVLRSLKRYDEALQSYERAITLEPWSATYWNDKGLVLGDLNRPEEALAAYDHAISLDETLKYPFANNGDVLRSLQRYDEALASYDRAIALDPKNASYWNDKGLTLGDANRPEEALAAYDQAIVLDPGEPAYVRNKAAGLQVLGRNDEALVAYDQAIAIAPGDALCWNGKGYVYKSMGRFNEGMECIERAIALAPDDGNLYDSKAEMFIGLGEYEKALTAINQALALTPALDYAWRNKARILDALGRTAEAREAEAQANTFGK